MPISQSVIADEEVTRPTYLEIDLDAIAHNYQQLKTHSQKPVMAIVKANAYGHGLVPVAQHLERCGCDSLGVAVLEEGIKLRRAGIRCEILVLGGILGDQIPLFLQHDLCLTASSVDKLQHIENTAAQMGTTAKVHLKIDTGMERIGVHYYSAQPLIEASLGCQHCEVKGIYTHFACADELDPNYTQTQLARFLSVCEIYEQLGATCPPRHAANSAALLRFPETHLDLVRAGIALYGIYPSPEVPRTLSLTPALRWYSKVVYFKVIRAGHPVSYGATWASETDTRLVTVPVGYGDGYFRALSDRARVLIRGHSYPVRGRVCMDQLMVDIGPDGEAYNGDPVLLLGQDGPHSITAEDLAQWANTIPYEVLTNINTRVSRQYVSSERR